MTTLQLISSEGFYGAESMLVTLGRAVARLGVRSMVGVLESRANSQSEVASEAQKAGLEVFAIPCEGRWDKKAVAKIRALIDENAVDVIHSHGYKTDIFTYWAARNRKFERSEVTLVATCHNWPDPSFRMQMYARIDRLALRGFDAVTTPSPVVEKILQRSGIKSHKLASIGNGVDVDRFRKVSPTLRARFGEHRKVIGFVGRLVPAKGGQVLIEAARHIAAAYPEVLFVFVGGGPAQAEWERAAEARGIADKVKFTGVLTDMPGTYASLDMLVLPSFNEAMPMTVLEAMSAGTPVVATAVGGTPRIVKNRETGMLCEPGSAGQIATAILTLLNDSQLAQELSRNAYKLVTSQFSAEVMARNYLEIYKKASLQDRRMAPVREFAR